MAAVLDPYSQPTQYGFRKNKSTANAVHYVRGVMEKGETTGTQTLFVLMDWDRAFDKVRHDALFKALQLKSQTSTDKPSRNYTDNPFVE